MKDKRYVIIDTDPGDDDAASILWVLANSSIDVLGITVTYGNVGLEYCVINALRTTEVAQRTNIPVFKGAFKPLVRPAIEASWIHGRDGFGDCGFSMPKGRATEGYAPVEMIRLAREAEKPVTILALAPLTNIALALLLDKDFSSYVQQIVFMGGAVRVSGNRTPRASYNVVADPEAAKIVYNSGIPIVQVGLDVCDFVTQEVSDLDSIAKASTPVTDFLVRLMEFRREKAIHTVKDSYGNIVKIIKASEQGGGRGSGIGLNDLTATGYLINPEWFDTKLMAGDIETMGLCVGETVLDSSGLWGKVPNVHFAYAVESRALVNQWVADMKNFPGSENSSKS